MEPSQTVSIRPGVSMLTILKHIEYDPWYALAEFVDNAIDSFLKNEARLKQIEGNAFKLRVKIELNDTDQKITIRDNAAGIHNQDYSRAFRAAEIPPDNTGLSEFGMGMKSAACWFSDRWSVRTSALGENIERTVAFDLKQIYKDKLEELDVSTSQATAETHYTVIELNDINKMPLRRTKGKIKDHLSSIYREFIRKGVLILSVDGEILKYEELKVLRAPFPHNSDNELIEWKREIDFVIEEGKLSVKGFVGLLETMHSGRNGFALFRRGRVIEGSGDEGFKPKEIMGEHGSPEWKRIFGELHLEGFEVSFTKKGIKWDENMGIFLDLLRRELMSINFLKQARDYRVNPSKQELKKIGDIVINNTVNDIKSFVEPVIEEIRTQVEPTSETTILTDTDDISSREFIFDFNNTKWLVNLQLTYDLDIANWIEVGSHFLDGQTGTSSFRNIGVRMSVRHPFVQQFAGADKSRLEPILRIAASIGLAEELARESGSKQPGVIRMNLNKLLTALSKNNLNPQPYDSNVA